MPEEQDGRDLQWADDGALRISSKDQLRAFDHPLRHRIVGRLGQEPATVSMLAEELGRPPGTIGHHTKVLEEAGLVEVVRTREVNGITERWLGRTARTFEFPRDVESGTKVEWLLSQFARARAVTDAAGASPHLLTVRIATIPSERAEEWSRRLLALAEEFAAEPVGGDTTHTMILGITAGTGIGDEP